MNWDDLRVMVAVGREGSFAKAARSLGLDETTVGRRVARLETALGARLFDAVDGTRRPTARCRAILAHAQDLERIAKAIAMPEDAAPPERELRLSTTASIAENVLAPGVDTLLRAAPGLSLTLQTSDENAEFARWETDLAIRLGRPETGAFLMRKIADLPYSLVRPRDPSRIVASAAYPERLAHAPEMRALASTRQAAPTRLRASHLGVIRGFLASGGGVGALPSFVARRLADNAAVEIEPLAARREVWLLTQPHLKNDPATRMVADWILERFAAIAAA